MAETGLNPAFATAAVMSDHGRHSFVEEGAFFILRIDEKNVSVAISHLGISLAGKHIPAAEAIGDLRCDPTCLIRKCPSGPHVRAPYQALGIIA